MKVPENRNNDSQNSNDKLDNEEIPTDAEECIIQGIQLAFHRYLIFNQGQLYLETRFPRSFPLVIYVYHILNKISIQ